MRPKVVAGNWKMYTDSASAQTLVHAIVDALRGASPACTVVVCPPFTALQSVHDLVRTTPVKLGAQNLFYEEEGAYTGEISAAMLCSVGCEFVIVGHSERRQYFGDTDATVNLRVQRALAHGLRPIVCVGETLAEREANTTASVVRRQVVGGLAGIAASAMEHITIAYEPVWAIGTGRTATPMQAQEVHALIRSVIAELFSTEVAANTPILYGGSVKPDNAAALFAEPDVDGGLVGGASLDAASFANIVQALAK